MCTTYTVDDDGFVVTGPHRTPDGRPIISVPGALSLGTLPLHRVRGAAGVVAYRLSVGWTRRVDGGLTPPTT